ncbi:MAG: hypothetical protein QOF76_407 [Solirubrobacteraceae bacterium]|jgi:hypothetical protein|nr:hypothetical protein [Solirubrobacteraceae bacterium]
MSHEPDNSHYVRRVVLPSGRSIEVVYFENEPVPAVTSPAHVEDLHVCPACEQHLVYPLEWEEHSATHWEVELRCPNCEWHTIDTYAQDVVDRFDEELDRGTEALVRDLKRLTRANMEEEVERFLAALSADAILPEDF